MIYKEYFTTSEFDDAWLTLQSYYREPDSIKNLYKTLFYTIRNLPIDEVHSASPLNVVLDFDNMIHIAGAPDPIEWLVGREVIFEKHEIAEKNCSAGTALKQPTEAEFAAHLLYWSTLYDFRTKTRHEKDFQQFLDSCENGTRDYSPENPDIALSLNRKRCYYWKEAIANDSAIDWRYILDIMRKRIEYHIGYHRYTERFVNSPFYISRMELCHRLLELAAADYYDMDGVYVNSRNASRYVGRIFNQYHYEKIGKAADFEEYYLSELRRAKAYKILWKFLDHNLTYWWD